MTLSPSSAAERKAATPETPRPTMTASASSVSSIRSSAMASGASGQGYSEVPDAEVPVFSGAASELLAVLWGAQPPRAVTVPPRPRRAVPVRNARRDSPRALFSVVKASCSVFGVCIVPIPFLELRSKRRTGCRVIPPTRRPQTMLSRQRPGCSGCKAWAQYGSCGERALSLRGYESGVPCHPKTDDKEETPDQLNEKKNRAVIARRGR